MTDRTISDRLRWWMEARFGLFLHWGVYAITARGEWEMRTNHVPPDEYARLADEFNPQHYDAREWVAYAQDAGMKYMVLTTRHHDGFCLFDSKVSDFTAPKTAAKRDLVADFADACHSMGMRVGFYYSLGDWRFHGTEPSGSSRPEDHDRMVEQAHSQVRELMTQYGKVDVLWYDGGWVGDIWRSAELNRMVRRLQPDIIINDRSRTPEDFGTPEGEVHALDRPWEACFTTNNSWGYRPGPRGYKSVEHLLGILADCAGQDGNFLLNVGPDADGRVPRESVERLQALGEWLRTYGEAIYGTRGFHLADHPYGATTRRGNTVYLLCHHLWPGETMPFAWCPHRIKSACVLPSRKPARVEQKGDRVWLHGLPHHAPNRYMSVIELQIEEGSR